MSQTPKPRVLCGLDSGSTVTKIAVVSDGIVLYTASAPTGTDPVGAGRSLAASARAELEKRGIPADGWEVCVTGYGRRILSSLGMQRTEIGCHAIGVHSLETGSLSPGASALGNPPKGFTLLDIGGQDSKAIRVDGEGRVRDFAMNDKCAAGTGRFLEVISRTLGCGIGGISQAALSSTRRARLSSMCTVFADSEVVSLVSRGERPDEIAWAACYAVAERSAGLVKRVGLDGILYFSGGVSEIAAVAEALGAILSARVTVPPLSRYAGALGAAVLAGAEPVEKI